MAKRHASLGGNGRGLPTVTREQLEAFKKMIALPPPLRRKVMESVVCYELVEQDKSRAQTLKNALSPASA